MITTGQSIGNYHILNKIGTGGMGAVYLAEHPLIGKKVALKVIHRELATNREVVQRFFQEAKAVNQIGNEHIVEIHDFGITPEGDHFYIMEFLEGRNLASVLGAESVLDVMRALHIGAQVASALAAAHASGVIHRDLKPDNVMLTLRLGDPDFVKLLDFGLAKMFIGGSSPVKTAAGVLLGTPQYMSPEACESRGNLDHRTDIYALGILLFQMMTGVLPFDGETMGEVLVKQVTQLPPPPRGYNPNIPPSVEQILLRCLQKVPDKRFPTMLALREALLDPEAYLHQSPPIAAARSLAPGEAKVDAKTVMAYVAQEQKTRIGFSAQMPAVGLPPPMPATASQQTMIGDGLLVPPRRATTQGPDMAVPAAPKTNTMRIATPLGYTSRPPKRVWPIVLVAALLLGLGGGAFAVAYFGSGKDAKAGTGSDVVAEVGSGSDTEHGASGSDTGHASGSDTGHASGSDTGQASGSSGSSGSDTGHAAAAIDAAVADAASDNSHTGSGTKVTPIPSEKLAVVVIDSMPQGAEVLAPDGTSAGKTPAKLSLPITSKQLTYELRMAGYRKKTKQFVVTGNAVIEVTLERNPIVVIPHKGSGAGSNKHCDTCLERPD